MINNCESGPLKDCAECGHSRWPGHCWCNSCAVRNRLRTSGSRIATASSVPVRSPLLLLRREQIPVVDDSSKSLYCKAKNSPVRNKQWKARPMMAAKTTSAFSTARAMIAVTIPHVNGGAPLWGFNLTPWFEHSPSLAQATLQVRSKEMDSTKCVSDMANRFTSAPL